MPRKFLGIVGQDPRDPKSNRLHVDILRFCILHLSWILQIPLKWSVILLKSRTSTGYFSNSTGSSVTAGSLRALVRIYPSWIHSGGAALEKSLRLKLLLLINTWSMCIQEHVVLSVAVFVDKKHGMMSRVSNFLNTGPFFLTTNLVSALWHHYENMAASENRVLAHFSWRDGICSCVTGLVVGVSGVWLCWSFIYAKYRLFLYQAMATNKQACLVTSDIIRNKFA